MITLEPMSAETWATWRIATIVGYARDKVRVGAWPAAGAEARARRELAILLPNGQATAGQSFCSIVNEAGQAVGALWYAPSADPDRVSLFIWDIGIAPEFRSQGYGRAALEALEPIARQLGYTEIGLHVFGDNEVARNLYRSAGYDETDVSMVKRLG